MEKTAARRVVQRESASGLARGMTCLLSAVLPREPEAPRAHNSPSKRGDRGHKAFERWLLGARREDIEHQVLGADFFDLDELFANAPNVKPIDGFPFSEVELWLNALTLECELGVAGTPQPKGWLRGRADQIGQVGLVEGNIVPCVLDLKCGNPNYQVGPDAAQLAYFALCLHIKFEAPQVASIVYLAKDPKHPRVKVWEAEELDEFARKLYEYECGLQLLETNDEMPAPVVSKECHWCPAKKNCPAFAKENPAVSAGELSAMFMGAAPRPLWRKEDAGNNL